MVYINHEYKIIVIENPKSGSTTLLDALSKSLGVDISRKSRCNYIHLTSADAKKDYLDYWDSYLKVTTYREPFKRFCSSILMRNHIAHFDIEHIETGSPINFNKFIKHYQQNKEMCCFCKSQEQFTNGVDHLIDVDNFQEDFDKLCDKLCVPKIIVPHLNKNYKTAATSSQLRAVFDFIS